MVVKKEVIRKVKAGKVTKPVQRVSMMHSLADLKKYAMKTDTKFLWVIGHGQQLRTKMTVPRGVYVVFLSRAGYLGSLNEIIENKPKFMPLWRERAKMRDFILGKLPESNIPNAPRFRTWSKRMYGPGDSMPDVYLELFDDSINHNMKIEYDALCGVHTVGQGSGAAYKYKARGIHAIIRAKGPGIYFVAACRGTVFQRKSSLRRVLEENFARHRGAHVITPAQNVIRAANEIRLAENQREQKVKRAMIRRRIQKIRARKVVPPVSYKINAMNTSN